MIKKLSQKRRRVEKKQTKETKIIKRTKNQRKILRNLNDFPNKNIEDFKHKSYKRERDIKTSTILSNINQRRELKLFLS